MGDRPDQDKIEADNADRSKRDKAEFLETVKDCEYMCARLKTIAISEKGVLMLENRAILFIIRNLSVDGQSFGEEDLRQRLEIGGNLFAYVKTASEVSGFFKQTNYRTNTPSRCHLAPL